MSKRPGITEKGSEPANKTIKVELLNIKSSSENGSESPEKNKKIEKPKNPKKCCYCLLGTAESCERCRNRRRYLVTTQCPSRKCSASNCNEEFHLHCYPYYSTGYIDPNSLICLYCSVSNSLRMLHMKKN